MIVLFRTSRLHPCYRISIDADSMHQQICSLDKRLRVTRLCACFLQFVSDLGTTIRGPFYYQSASLSIVSQIDG